MEHWICQKCGTQFAPSERPPEICPICCDERQYVGYKGQQWTTLAHMQEDGFQNEFREHEPGLIGIGTTPSFAIGERALLLQHQQGNVLWDCMSLIDDETVAEIERLGGLTSLAISHPHYYSIMVEWARCFDIPIYLHETDRQWVMRPDEHITFWSGETCSMKDGVTLICLGGHFSGGTVLHWQQGASGNEILLSGDVMNTREEWVSMREAASRLKAEGFKISPNKISRLASRNKIRTQEDPLDERVKLVELNELRALSSPPVKPLRFYAWGYQGVPFGGAMGGDA